jgi:hypothetical protein
MAQDSLDKFVCYFYFVSWKCLSVGVSVCLKPLNVELHLPFGFIRVGWDKLSTEPFINQEQISWRTFGYTPRGYY